MLAAPAQATPPPGNYQGGLYPRYAYPYYPAYQPFSSYSSPGSYNFSGATRFNGYVPGTNYAPGFDPGFASSYARIGPASGPTSVSHTRFYIPSYIRGDAARSVDNTAHIEVLVPGEAALWFNGWKARSTGVVRKLQSPPLTPGRNYTYTVRARWEENGREVTQTRQVAVSAGAKVRVDFLEGSGAGLDEKKQKEP